MLDLLAWKFEFQNIILNVGVEVFAFEISKFLSLFEI